MKSLNGVILGVLLVVIIIWGVVAYNKNQNNDEGGLTVGITDATADINNVSDIEMAVKKVEVHSATEGWVTISSDSKNYKLLELHSNGQTKLYAKNRDLQAGTYDKVRVTLGDTTIKTKTTGDVKAVLPSNVLVMNSTINVTDDQNSYITLDFLADKSLHLTSDSRYVFVPVVRSESRSNADVTVGSDDNVIVSGGTVDGNSTVGMDLDGSSRGNFQLQTGSDFKIVSENNGIINFSFGGKNYSSNASMNRENQDGASNSMDKSENGSETGAINGSGSSSTTTNGSSTTNSNGTSSTGVSGSVNTNTNTSSGSTTTTGGLNLNLRQ
jgi:hypothetical protein